MIKAIVVFFICLVFSLILTCPFGCVSSGDDFHFVDYSYPAPKLCGLKVLSADSLLCTFNKNISFSCYAITDIKKNESLPAKLSFPDSENVCINLLKKTEIGKEYLLSAQVSDTSGNSLMLEVNFSGINDNKASLVLSELRDGYSSKKKECEFIELYVVKAGNTAGLEIYSAYDGEKKLYKMPSLDVKSGDFITIHMRTLMPDENVSEVNGDKTFGRGVDSCKSAFDIWNAGNEAHFGADYDVILLRDSDNGAIYDALCYRKAAKIFAWPKKTCEDALKKAYEAGVWNGENIDSAFNADGLTLTHSIARQNLNKLKNVHYPMKVSASDWIVTENRKAITPGFSNSSKKIKKSI
ncbi:MAG: hypothetical protein K6F69_04835 [Treponema sp.]|nr:hypothetical protein [Treponema sp.]